MLAPLNVILFDQIRALASVEPSDDIQSLIVEGNGRVEVPARVQAPDLSPRVTCHIVHLALVHALTRQATTDRVDTTSTPASQDRGQGMGSSFKDHVTTLLQTLVNELVTAFCGFTWLAAPRQKDATFLVFYGHEVSRYLDIDDVATVRVRREIVHEEVVRIVDEKVKRVDHFAVVADQGHLYCLLDDLTQGLFRAEFFTQQFNLHLLLRFLDQELSLADDLF